MTTSDQMKRLEALEAEARKVDMGPELERLAAESGIDAADILAEGERISRAIAGMNRFEAEDWLVADLVNSTTLNEMEALEIVRSWGV